MNFIDCYTDYNTIFQSKMKAEYTAIFSEFKTILKHINVYTIFNFFKSKKINIHQLLTNIDPMLLDQSTVYILINEGILDIHEQDVNYGKYDNFKNYMSNMDDSLLVSIINRIETEHSEYFMSEEIHDKIDKIQQLRNSRELTRYILFNNDFYLPLLWSGWNCFNRSDIENYIKYGWFNPFKTRPEFDGSDLQGINYLQHLEILEREYVCDRTTNSRHTLSELQKLIVFIKNIKYN
jgi:hypothetical protein